MVYSLVIDTGAFTIAAARRVAGTAL